MLKIHRIRLGLFGQIFKNPKTIFAQDKDSGPMRAVKKRLSIYDSSLSKPFDFIALESSNTYATDQLVRETAWDYMGDMCVLNTTLYNTCVVHRKYFSTDSVY